MLLSDIGCIVSGFSLLFMIWDYRAKIRYDLSKAHEKKNLIIASFGAFVRNKERNHPEQARYYRNTASPLYRKFSREIELYYETGNMEKLIESVIAISEGSDFSKEEISAWKA